MLCPFAPALNDSVRASGGVTQPWRIFAGPAMHTRPPPCFQRIVGMSEIRLSLEWVAMMSFLWAGRARAYSCMVAKRDRWSRQAFGLKATPGGIPETGVSAGVSLPELSMLLIAAFCGCLLA